MKLENYFPTFRNVLLQVVEKDKLTKGGIIIPSLVLESATASDKEYQIVKTGKDCIELRTGDTVRLMRGLQPEALEFEDRTLYQVMEQQVIGYLRELE